MNEKSFFCLAHRPEPKDIPWGYALTPDLEYHKCQLCQEQSRVELSPKALNYPRLTTG